MERREKIVNGVRTYEKWGLVLKEFTKGLQSWVYIRDVSGGVGVDYDLLRLQYWHLIGVNDITLTDPTTTNYDLVKEEFTSKGHVVEVCFRRDPILMQDIVVKGKGCLPRPSKDAGPCLVRLPTPSAQSREKALGEYGISLYIYIYIYIYIYMYI